MPREAARIEEEINWRARPAVSSNYLTVVSPRGGGASAEVCHPVRLDRNGLRNKFGYPNFLSSSH